MPEVVIVNYKKCDRYGELDQRIIGRGASDWFKAEVKGFHDRGFEVYSAIEDVVIRRGKAFRVRHEGAPGACKVYVVGRIPYERIAFIDWEPDPSYNAPRFYVVYTWRRDPYREVVLYEDGPGDYQFQVEAKYKGKRWRPDQTAASPGATRSFPARGASRAATMTTRRVTDLRSRPGHRCTGERPART